MAGLDYEDLHVGWVDDDNGGDLITVADRRQGTTLLSLSPLEMLNLIWQALGPIQDALRAQVGVPYQQVCRIAAPADLGPVLRQARNEAGLTQEQLAQKVGAGVSTITTHEVGSRQPRLPMLLDVLQALGCELVIRR